jgi:hypothetical protein
VSGRYTYGQAVEHLPIEESWLRRHIKQLPHTKIGRTVYFTDADLERIDALFHHEPATGPLATAPEPKAGTNAHPLAHLRPLPRRGTALQNAS